MIEATASTITEANYPEYEELTTYTRYGINLHPIWLAAYLESFGYENKELILEARDRNSGKLCGLLPLLRKDEQTSRLLKHRRLVPLGYRPTDFFDIPSVPGMEIEVARAFAEWLRTNYRLWDSLIINFIPYESTSWQPLVEHLIKEGLTPEVATDKGYLKIDTTKSYDEYLKDLGTEKQKDRKSVV